MSDVLSAYGRNTSETRENVRLTPAQLTGVPADRLATYKREGDTYVVPATESNLGVIVRLASDPNARQRSYRAYVAQVAV